MDSFKSVPFTRVRFNDRFWAPRIETNRRVTIPIEYEQCRATGRLDAYKLDWKPGQPNPPHQFWDSDVAKLIEAAAYSLATRPDKALEARLDKVIATMAKAQQKDGYLNPHFTVVNPKGRFKNLTGDHELYCAGHLIEAAVAHFQATGKRSLLGIMLKYVSLIYKTFGRKKGQIRGYCGHEEIELALVKLYHATGDRACLDLAAYFINERGQAPIFFKREMEARGEKWEGSWLNGGKHVQAHLPVRQQKEVVGHAVRCMYLYSGMADVARETKDASLLKACRVLWDDLCRGKLYLTGGVGNSRHNEGFTYPYDLYNEGGYAETCAAIGLVFWAHRLLKVDLDGRYGDMMERALYNGVLSGVSLDGKKFFYENPLASMGTHRRQDWFGCSCCPPNVARLLASLGEYVYSTDEKGLVVHLYGASKAEMAVGGRQVSLTQQTAYPWDGKVGLTFGMKGSADFTLKLRLPGWCRKYSLKVNGAKAAAKLEKGYLAVKRAWRNSDRVELNLEMPVERVYAHPKLRFDCGRVALARGPVVYCLEAADNGGDLNALALARKAPINRRWEPGLLGGVVTLEFSMEAMKQADWKGTLYRAASPSAARKKVKAIPYCVWENRKPGEMLVWMREVIQ